MKLHHAPLLLLLSLPTSIAAQNWAPPSERGLVEKTGLLHLHSPYSHDACDDMPRTEDGESNPWCLADLREDICDVPHGYYMLTDHRTHMAEQPFVDLYLHDEAAGDRWVRDQDGQIIANEVQCVRGDRTWSTYIMVGLEGSHNLPVGLTQHLSNPDLYSVGFGNEEPLELQIEEINDIHQQGGLALLAHAEEDDVTPEHLLQLPIDGIELYNAHSNIITLAETHPLKILWLEGWLLGAEDAPVSDYLALLMFPNRAQSPLEKWDAVAPFRTLSGVIGTDVHENVTLTTAYCSLRPLEKFCARLAQYFPNTISYLEQGGPIIMADGERLDSYQRMFRWFSNHTLLSDPSPNGIKAALKGGQNYITFDILGSPVGFDFLVTQGDGSILEMGGEGDWSPGSTLMLALPNLSTLDIRGETWSEETLEKSTITARLLRVDATGSEFVAELNGANAVLEYETPGPGVYRVEVSIRPKHLTSKLGAQGHLAERVYPWIWSNPIYLR